MDNLSLSVIVAQIINFWIIFFLFKYLLWSKLVLLLNKRRKQLSSLEWSDEEVRKKIEEAEKEKFRILEEARKKAQDLIKKNEEILKKDIEIRLSEAEKKAESIIESAKRDIEKERWTMLEEMKNKVLDLSLKINWKVFWDSEKNKEFIEKEVANVKI